MFSLTRFAAKIRRAKQRPKRVASTRRLCLEALEDRLCPSGGYLVVASYDNNSILRYNESTGAFVDQIDPKNLANENEPVAVLFGPNHNLFLSDRQFENSHQDVLQYDGTTGAFLNVFASQNLTSPRGILFGPDGDLYVANSDLSVNPAVGSIERFDGKTGGFLNYFVPPGSGGISHCVFMVFGPDGNLYVSQAHTGSILRYYGPNSATPGAPDPAPGQSGAFYVPDGGDGLNAVQGITFGPDGNIYIAKMLSAPITKGDQPPGSVLKIEGPSGPNPGALLGTFIAGGYGGLGNPEAVLFGPNGDMYVSSYVAHSGDGKSFDAEPGSSVVLRYDGTTGAFLGTFVTPDSGGLRWPVSMTFSETDPTTLNYDAPSAQTASTATPTRTLPIAAAPRISIGTLQSGSDIDPTGVSLSQALSPPSALPTASREPVLALSQVPQSSPSLTSNLPKVGASAASNWMIGGEIV